eukprot:1196248-Prorocentrum_minimum.AAC.2
MLNRGKCGGEESMPRGLTAARAHLLSRAGPQPLCGTARSEASPESAGSAGICASMEATHQLPFEPNYVLAHLARTQNASGNRGGISDCHSLAGVRSPEGSVTWAIP